ncbi:MAG: hypothetical protein LBI40_03455 [Treponema sp.]|nr:hypothetical protein [Treponema sp.]
MRWLLFLLPLLAFPFAASSEEIDIMQRLGAVGVPFEERELFPQYGGFGVSIHVPLPTAPDPIGSVAVAVPLASSSFTQEVLSSFIEKRAALKSRVAVKAAFLADEYSALPADMRKNAHAGLDDLCAGLTSETILIYLDFDVPPQKLLFINGAKGWVTPLALVNPLSALCKQNNIPYALSASNNAFFRWGLMDGRSAAVFAGKQGINTLFISGQKGAATDLVAAAAEPLTAAAIANLLVEYVDAIEWSDAQMNDTHFITATNAAGQVRFISETALVVIMLICAALFLIVLSVYSIVKRNLFIAQLKILLVYSWVLLFLIALFFAVSEGVGVFVSLVSRAVHVFDAWTALLKIIIGFLTYSLIASLFDGLKIPGKQRFFGSAALFLGAVNLLVVIFIDITFAPIFAVCLACIVVGTVSDLPIVCYTAALLLPLQSTSLFIEFLGNDNGELTRLVMNTEVRVNLLITSWTLPIWLILKRGNLLLNTGSKRQKPTLVKKPTVGFLIRITFLFVFLFIAVQFLFYQLKIIPSQPESVRRVSETGNGLIIDVKESLFLNRRIYEVSVSGEGRPCRFDITLDSDSTGALRNLLYSCSAPLRFDGGGIELVLGENPPNPFFFEIAFSAASSTDFTATISVDVVYAVYDPSVDAAAEPETEDYTFTVKGVRELRE